MTVYLVGAGPGDPELLTLRAARLLGQADVVLFDRLVSEAVLQLAPAWAVLVPVGKNPNGASTSQDEIERLLASYGRQADTVVRLKGGDPLVFGRGSEEAAALANAGVEVQIVPGVSSALAAPAAAGVPVTARGIASGVTIVTGHQCDSPDNPLDWRALATLGTTLVVLMGAQRAATIALRLIDAGMAPTTPVAITTRATRPDQKVQRCDLATLRNLVGIENPSVLTIGDVAGVADLPIYTAAVEAAGVR